MKKRSSSQGPELSRTNKKVPEECTKQVEEEEELEFEDDFEDEFEEEEIYDAQFEDVEINLEAAPQRAAAPSVFRPGIDQLEEGHVLEPEPGTYKMLHRLDVQWPCLSFDVLPDALGKNRTKFPMAAYVVSGTQADEGDKNKLVVMKWSNLQRTNRDGLEDDEDEEEEEARRNKFRTENDQDDDDEGDDEADGDPELEFRMIRHQGGVNRVRAMPQMSTLVASWSDNGNVYIHNIHAELEALEGRANNVFPTSAPPVHVFASGRKTEGYGMAWNPHQVGMFASGDCKGNTYLWNPAPGGSWTQSLIGSSSSVSFPFESVEDIEFKKTGDNCANIFALCGGSAGKVGIVDVRNSSKLAASHWTAHSGDTNVLSWNPIVGQLLLTGGDDGTFKVWDVRAVSRGALANFKWHKDAITSLDWHPTDEATLAVSSADDTTSIWDMSVEEDLTVSPDVVNAEYYPPQLLFLHMGQKSVKEIKFHAQMPGVVVSTAFDGFNIFKTFNI
jgi:ribosome assembly protein RRB1